MNTLETLLRVFAILFCISGVIYFIYGIYVIWQSHTKERQLQSRIQKAMSELDNLIEDERQKPPEPDHR